MPDDLLENLGMFVRGSVLARFLEFDAMYRRILDLPGCIMEFGTWFGQGTILTENLRAIHEPFNKQRKIIGFDTFEGFAGFSEEDGTDEIFKANAYSTSKDHKHYLEQLLRVHEECNALGHMSIHELVEGDVRETLPAYLAKHPETWIALAHFDIGLYEPTKCILEAIRPHLVPGAILHFRQLTRPQLPGDAKAFKEVMRGLRYRIEKAPHYPTSTTVTLL